MRNDDGMTSAERELGAALAGLAPAQSRIDRDGVMFCAGQASVRRRSRLWQGLSSGLLILLLASILTRPVRTEVERHPEVVAEPILATSSLAIEPIDRKQLEAFRQYVRTRQAVLDRGVEAIPTSSGLKRDSVAPPLTRENLEELLSST